MGVLTLVLGVRTSLGLRGLCPSASSVPGCVALGLVLAALAADSVPSAWGSPRPFLHLHPPSWQQLLSDSGLAHLAGRVRATGGNGDLNLLVSYQKTQ